MATDPQFLSTIRTEVGQISTANTNRDGTGSITSIFTAGASGSKVLTIEIKAVSTTTAGMIRIYLNDGVNIRLWQEVNVSAITPSTTVQTFYGRVAPDFILESGYTVSASTNNAETFNIIITGGDY